MELRPFQEALVDGARQHIRRGVRRLLLQLATGGGKTVVAAFIVRGARARQLRVWFVVHRKELLKQTSATFEAIGIPHGFIAADLPAAEHEPVQLCGVQTLAGRLDGLASPDVIVWDEAHHATAGTWTAIMLRYPGAVHIGLSATPQRLDGAGLKQHFDAMICGPTTAELIRDGFLSPYRYYAPGQPDLVGVRRTAGDFNRGDLGDLMDKPSLVGDVVDHYLRLAPGVQGIVFAVNREHSRHLADAFRAAGVPAQHVDGSMTAAERDRFDAAFRAGDVRVGCNVELFGEGYDVPGIGYVGVARPTSSLSWHRQMLGRGLRTAPGKGAAVLVDHAGNALRGLGLPDDDVTWTLEGRVKRAGRAAANDASPVHQCPSCYQVTASTVATCPCGHEFAVRGREVEARGGELFELTRLGKAERLLLEAQRREKRKAEEREARTLPDLVKLARERGYQSPEGWARKRMELREQYARGGRRYAGAAR